MHNSMSLWWNVIKYFYSSADLEYFAFVLLYTSVSLPLRGKCCTFSPLHIYMTPSLWRFQAPDDLQKYMLY